MVHVRHNRHAVRIRSVVRIIASIAVRVRRIVAISSRVLHIRRVPRVVPKAARSLRPALRPVHRHRTPAPSVHRHLSPANHRIVQKARRVVVAGVVAGVGVAQAARKKALVSARKAR